MNTYQVYVGTYKKYNEGSIDGEWLDLTHYSDLEEFYEACRKLHEDENDPEYMFQDTDVPNELIGYINESSIDEKIFKTIKVFEEMEENAVILWEEYCDENSIDDRIYNFDEHFFETFFADKPVEAARAASFGNLNWGHDYIYFNGYGNLESTDDSEHFVDKTVLLQWLVDNK